MLALVPVIRLLIILGAAAFAACAPESRVSSVVAGSDTCNQLPSIEVPLRRPGQRPTVSTFQILFGLSTMTSRDFPETTPKGATELIPERWTVRCAEVHAAALPLYASLEDSESSISVLSRLKTDLFASGLYRRLRHANRSDIQVDDDLDAFMRRHGFGMGGATLGDWLLPEGWIRHDRVPSRVKGRVRVLLRSPATRSLGMSIALTLDAQSLQGSELSTIRVLETEVILQRERSTHVWDFYAYDAAGRLSDAGEFHSGKGFVRGPVPHTCMGCHFDRDQGTYGPRPLSYRQ